jgi:hypothetical protein
MSEDYDRPRRGEAATSGKAIASLIFGLLFCIPIIAPILAIVLGALGLRDIGRSEGRLKGQGLAIAGMVTGGIGLVILGPLVLIGIALLLPAVHNVRVAASRVQSQNNMKQMGLAFHNYHDTYGTFPPAVVYSPDGKPLYSWRVLLLPFLGEERLYRQFKLNEPWDSPNNKPLLAQMPMVYEDPVHASRGQPAAPYVTHYQVLTGGGALFDLGPKAPLRTIASITDGTSNTILAVEAPVPVRWTEPEDVPYAPDQPLPWLGHAESRNINLLMADGSVRSLPKNIDEKTLRALITYNGNEIVKVPE